MMIRKLFYTWYLSLFLIPFSLSAQENSWLAIMAEGYEDELIDYGEVFPTQFVKSSWIDDYYITDATYGGGYWIVTTKDNTPYTAQKYKTSANFPSTWIDENWATHSITHIGYGGGEWLVVMSKGAGTYGEAWGLRSSVEEIETYIGNNWNENRDIVSISYGNGSWAAVLAKGTGFRHQKYTYSATFPTNWVENNNDDGYNVTSVTYGEGYWFVVMSKLPVYLEETYEVSADFPAEHIEEEWEYDLRISKICYSNGVTRSATFDEYFEAGIDAASEGDNETAIYYYTKALEIDPNHATALNNRAWAKYLSGNCHGALTDAEKSVKIDSDEHNLHTRGAVYLCLDRCHDALNDFDKALSMASSKDVYYYVDRGAARGCVGNFKGAVEDYEKAIDLDPSNASYYRQEKEIYEKHLRQDQPPTITWDYPYNAFASTTSSQYEIKACIHAETSIQDIEVLVNGSSFTSRGFGIDSDCTETVNQTISLKSGVNTIQIVVKTTDHTVESEKRVIEYKAKSSGNYHAIVIGVQDYDDYSIRNLEKPISDAKTLKSTLVENYTFEEGDVHLLENPTKQDILDKLIYMQERLGPNDNLLIFYSGHGVVKNDIGYWLPRDAKKDNRTAWLSNAELRDYINSINTQHTLVVADACFSGSLLTGGYRDMTDFACQEMAKLPSRRAMTSGANTIVPDESVFFKYLIQKLEENPESCLSAEVLYSKIKPAVIYNSPNNQIPQFGVLPQMGDEGGDFIFRRRN